MATTYRLQNNRHRPTKALLIPINAADK